MVVQRDRGASQAVGGVSQLQPLVVFTGKADAPLVFKQQHVPSAAILGAAGGGSKLQVFHGLGVLTTQRTKRKGMPSITMSV